MLQPGASVRVPGAFEQSYSTVCYLTDGERHVLIDPGDYVSLSFLEERLAARSLGPEDITDVLLTHLHLDHAYATRFFPNATVHIHPAYRNKPYEKFGVFKSRLYLETMKSWRDVSPLQPGAILFGAVRVFHTPWHAREHCSFLIESENMGIVLYTGDIVMNKVEFFDIARWLRRDDCARFVNKVGRMADYIVFSHDGHVASGEFLK